jgi:hypothetical protein
MRTFCSIARSVPGTRNREYQEPHRRGEILVAAMLNAFGEAWVSQIAHLGEVRPGCVDRGKVVEEGAQAANGS